MYFGEDFDFFSEEMFLSLRHDTRRCLRDFLRQKGVFVERRHGVLTSDALCTAAQDEQEWPISESTTADNMG